jgi:hypothetical protein
MSITRQGRTEADIQVSRLPPHVDPGVVFAVGSNPDIDTTSHLQTSSELKLATR